MKLFLLIIISAFAFSNAHGQHNSICHEQAALNFLQDSIIKNTYSIKFSGQSDTVKTVLVNSCLAQYPVEDEALKKYLESEKEVLSEMNLNNDFSGIIDQNGVVELTLRNNKRSLFQFRKKCTLAVEQHIHIEDRVCVEIVLERNYKSYTYYYFMLNSEGEILNYCTQKLHFSRARGVILK